MSAIDNKIILSVEGLTIEFGDTRAVDDVNFSVSAGQTVSIVGASGSGKSVSSLALMGLLHPSAKITSGKAFFTDSTGRRRDLLSIDKDEHRSLRGSEIGMIFQEPMTALNPVHRCGDQVVEALLSERAMTRSQREARVIELFEQVQLPHPKEAFRKYPHQMSGGQKQRVMIAMAMSRKPHLLIADEPTTALDVTVQHEILELLATLQKEEGMAMLFITHDLGVVHDIADTVVVMHHGRVVENGSVSRVLNNPSHPYTQGLINCRPPLDAYPARLPTVQDYLEKAPERVMIPSDTRRKTAKAHMEAPPLLEVRGLSKSFGKGEQTVPVLNALDFQIYPGETLGLVGGSGSGKTTLGRSILKLIDPDSGSVKYKGTELSGLSEQDFRQFRRKLQIIFQDPYSSLNPKLTVGAAIMEVLKVHGRFDSDAERKNHILNLLNKVGLNESHYERFPHEFSGGQRQRIVIARTIALEPELVICDESVSALDVSIQAQVLNLLNDLKEEHGLTYVFISHDMAVVKYMSDRMIVLDKGSIAEAGIAEDIFSDPRSPASQALINAIPGRGTAL